MSRLRPGEGKANEHAVILSDGGCQSPQLSSVLTIEASAEVAQLAKVGNNSQVWSLLQQCLCLPIDHFYLLNKQDLGDPISSSLIPQDKKCFLEGDGRMEPWRKGISCCHVVERDERVLCAGLAQL